VDKNPEIDPLADAEADAVETHDFIDDQPGKEAGQPTVELHPFLNGSSFRVFFSSRPFAHYTSGQPCDKKGNTLPPGTPPPV
jgi:hypothetical protein